MLSRGGFTIRRFRYVAFGLAFVVAYTWGALYHGLEKNTLIGRFDQMTGLAKDVKLSNYALTFPRNQMPVYPVLLSSIYNARLSDAEFFERAKYFNVALSLLILAALSFIFWKRFPTWVAMNLFLITSFTVFIFKASYVQPELLYYFLSFVVFLLMIEMIRSPTLLKAVALGGIAGVAYLTKAAILPALALFLTVSFVRDSINAIQRKGNLRSFATLALVVLSFIAVIFPYAKNTKRLYGRYLFNINTSFYIWHDNWREATAHLRQAGGIENIPKESRPSFRKYVHNHTVAQIMERFLKGGGELILVAVMAYGYFEYFVAFLGIFCVLCWFRRKIVGAEIRKQPALSAFLFLYFGVHLALYAFYVPIAPGERFSLSQFLPAMYILPLASLKLSQKQPMTLFKRDVDVFYVFNVAISLVVCLDIYSILTKKLLWMHGGS